MTTKRVSQFTLFFVAFLFFVSCNHRKQNRPNILLIISDDQSYPHASIYGDSSLSTPAFDRIANEGILFTHCFCPASQCSPSRAALLTGKNIWQLEEAGTHASIFPSKFEVYTEILEKNGYQIAYTGKPWAPGSWKDGGRSANPAGKEFNRLKLVPPTNKINKCDYAENFREFLMKRNADKPFCFWMGCYEPHRDYELNSALKLGKKTHEILPPEFLPEDEIVQNDLLDYKLEIEWFDKQIEKVLKILEDNNQLDNTLIVVSSDNGMPFPRAKANLYDAGTRVPMAVRWGDEVQKGRVVDDMVSFIDYAPTFLEVANINDVPEFTGKSLHKILRSKKSGIIETDRDFVVLGKERHNQARPDNVGYPSRAIRTRGYLYIRNLKNDRWPLGDPPYYFCHTKMNNPSKDFILKNKEKKEISTFYEITYAKRPTEELYDIVRDPACIHNLVDNANYTSVKNELKHKLEQILVEQNDPRMLGNGDIFESYPYYQKIYDVFPGFKEFGKYNPKYSAE